MKKIITLALMLLAASFIYADGTAVVYFSATGNTERVAQIIADRLDADIYEITAAEPYSSSDLNWRDEESRVWDEHRIYPDIRPGMAQEIDLSDYDTVFLGYPLWWGEAPAIVLTFLESTDLEGKTVIPFCTSSSSGLGNSDENLHSLQPAASWHEGHRFRSRASESDVADWLDELGLQA